MALYLETIRNQAQKSGISPNPAEIALWNSAYTLDTSSRLAVNEETSKISQQRVWQVLEKMSVSANPYFREAADLVSYLSNAGQIDSVLEGRLTVGGREAGAVVSVAEGQRFILNLHLNIPVILNRISALDLASVLTHEVGGHAQARLDHFRTLNDSVTDRSQEVKARFSQPRIKIQDESQAYKLQAESVITAVGHGLTDFSDITLEMAAIYCDTVKRGRDQKWEKFVAPRV